MTPAKRSAQVRRELDALLRDGLIDSGQHAALAQRYPATAWHWQALGRWFLVFGTITTAAGVIILARTVFEFTLEKLALALTLVVLGSFAGARVLAHRRPALLWTARALELGGGLTLIGLSFTLGIIYSSGSGNWPALLLIDLCLLLPLSYLLGNVLLLTLSAVVFFCWFGGFTGYAPGGGGGVYWFGMSYPLRFLVAAAAIVAFSAAHHLAEHGALARFRGFFKVWLASGLFFGEMAAWLLSLFGNFDLDRGYEIAGATELIMFNLLWASLNVTLVYLGTRLRFRMLTGFGATFLIIQVYTLFFAHLAEGLGAFLTFFIAGGATLWLVIALERRRRRSSLD